MLPALIVGGLTAWFLGMKPGVIAAAITLVAVIVASVIPGATFTIWALILGWCALLYFFGAKIRKPNAATQIAGGTIGQLGRWVGRARKLWNNATDERQQRR